MKYILAFLFSVLALGAALALAGATLNCSLEMWLLRFFICGYMASRGVFLLLAEKITRNGQR